MPTEADCTVNGAVQAQQATSSGTVAVSENCFITGAVQAQSATTIGVIGTIFFEFVTGEVQAQPATTSGSIDVVARPQVLADVEALRATTSGLIDIFTTVQVNGAAQAGEATTQGIVGPPVDGPYDLRMKLPNDQWISLTDHQNLINIGQDDHHILYEWKGGWAAGTYDAGHQVLDNGWLMTANKTTIDRAAPQVVGAPFFIYEGTPTTQSATAKQIIVGGRYSPQVRAQLLVACRIFLTFEHDYIVYIVRDPTGTPVLTEVAAFTAEQGGWQTINLPGGFVQVGEIVDVLAIVKEPDPVPVQFTGDWVYSSPQNPAAPAAGEVIHSRSSTSVISWSKTDADLVDRSVDLATLEVGDTISDGAITWAIQSISDQGTYYNYGVAPAINGVEGRNTYTFETVTASLLSYELDTDYWLGNPEAQGLYGADIPYEDIVPDNNQYSVDIEVQDYSTSPDWDVQSQSGGKSTTPLLSLEEYLWVSTQAAGYTLITGAVSGPVWQEIGRRLINDGEGFSIRLKAEAKRTDGFGYGTSEHVGMAWRDGTTDGDFDIQYEHATSPLMNTRFIIDGNDVVFEGRSAPGESWSLTVFAYFNPIGD